MDLEKSEVPSPRYYGPHRSNSSAFIHKRPLLGLTLIFCSLFLFKSLFQSKSMQKPSMSMTNTSSEPKSDGSITLGIALTPTYGTVAIRNGSGALISVAKEPGDHEYVEMMKRLSDKSSLHPSPPYRTIGDSIADWPRQTLRHVRKGLGCPASSDVGTMARMIINLKDLALAHTGHTMPIRGAVLALPSIIGLYEEDVCDAFEYCNIHDLVGTHIIHEHPRAISAAYAGYGFGGCEHWKEPETCRQEFINLPLRQTLLIDYSRRALSVDMDGLKAPAGYRSYDSHHPVVDFGAGSDSKSPGKDDPHWARVRNRIETIVNGSVFRKLNLVLLSGESAEDPVLKDIVRMSMKKYGEPDIQLSDPEFVAAKGASEMAWQAAEIQNMFPEKKYYCMGPR